MKYFQNSEQDCKTRLDNYLENSFCSVIIIILSMELRVSSRVISFVLGVKRYLSHHRLTLDEFLLESKLLSPRYISQQEFARIVQRMNGEGETFNHLLLFDELAKGTSVITRETLNFAFFKVFKVDHLQLQGESIGLKSKTIPRLESNPLEERGKKLAEIGLNQLCKYMMKNQRHLQKVFNDCDLDRSGYVDKNEFNKLLCAVGVREFQDKDVRRYLTSHVFHTIKTGRLSKDQFFRLSETFRQTKPFFLSPDNAAAKKGKIKTFKNISIHNSPIKPLLRAKNEASLHPEMKVQSIANNPSIINKSNIPTEQPKLEASLISQNNLKGFSHAGKYFRLGTPTPEDIPYIEELQRLLVNKKIYSDPKNPTASGSYVAASKIFDGSNYDLFELSPQQMNSDRKNNKIGQFIEADDIMQGQVGDCYFLSAIGSLAADYPELASQKFLFEANPAGYNAVKLFIDGEWKIIKTDDMYPFAEDRVIYAKPNSHETWVMLLEKSFAKVFGSYQAIQSGYSEEAFFALTGAPNEYIDLQKEKDLQALKLRVEAADHSGFLMATAGNNYLAGLSQEIKDRMGLISGHAYSLIFIREIDDLTFVKLRNPWGNTVWKGQWCFDSPKWTPKLRKSLEFEKQQQDGIFYMVWEDYCKYYGNISICKINPTNVHSSFRMVNNKKKSSYIKMTVSKAGIYDIFICQESERKYANESNFKLSNSRLIIMKEEKDGRKTFVAAKSSSEQICNLEVSLELGVYLISAKVSWQLWTDHECYLTSYGPQKVAFEKIDRAIAPEFKQKLIESFAASNQVKAEISSYEDSGYKGLVTETYFSMEEGIGYIKTSNKTKKNFTIETTFELTGLKVIKPKANPYVLNIKAGKEDILGFMVSAEGYQYSYNYSLTTTK